MCLTVREVPDTPVDGLVVPCWKRVQVDYRSDRLYPPPGSPLTRYISSPIYPTPIPASGWLVPHTRSRRRTFRSYTDIGGGFIHASLPPRVLAHIGPTTFSSGTYKPFTPRGFKPTPIPTASSGSGYLPAYAVQTVAFGDAYHISGNDYRTQWQDLVCRALYIPECDTQSTPPQKRAIIRTLRDYAYYTDGTAKDLVSAFPHLSKYLVVEK